MPSFSARSKKALETCHPDLQLIANEAIQVYDFTVIFGHRTEEQQNKLYPKFTKVKWPDSKHNKDPSEAIDVVPYVKGIGALTGSRKQIHDLMLRFNKSQARIEQELWWQFGRLAAYFDQAARRNDISIRCGADWNSDGRLLDERFVDAGHFELV